MSLLPLINLGSGGWIFPPETIFLHMLIMGATGTGKTSLILSILEQVMRYGKKVAVIFIDPSGFAARDAYALSKGKARYLSLDNPICINPLAQPFSPHQLIEILKEMINHVTRVTTSSEALSARQTNILTRAATNCIKRGELSIQGLINYISNPRHVKRDLSSEALIDRLSLAVNNPIIKEMMCGKNPMNIGKLVDQSESLIVDTFGMSEGEMAMVGSTITFTVKGYFRFLRRKEYKPLMLVLDEFHLFSDSNMLSILKESRKFNISFVGASQDFALIPHELTRVMLSNVGTLVSFRVGAKEAELLAREFENIRPWEIQFLKKYHLAYRMPDKEGIIRANFPPLVKEIPLPEKSEEKPQPGSVPVLKPEWWEAGTSVQNIR